MGNKALIDENQFLKNRIRENFQREIELQDKIEEIEYELILRKQKDMTINLKGKNKDREEIKIKQLNEKLKYFQNKNKELRQIYDVIYLLKLDYLNKKRKWIQMYLP